MAQAVRYDLAFTVPSSRESPFARAVASAAQRRRVRWLSILRRSLETVRSRVDRGSIQVGLFLNAQADGTRPDSPSMLLGRSLKAAGCLVIEDPDDAPIYTNRALQLNYLKRAGLAVPAHVVLEGWRPNKRALTPAERAKLGSTWRAQPVAGRGGPALVSTARSVSPVLARGGVKAGQDVLLCREHDPVTANGRALRIRAWHFLGDVVACWSAGADGGATEPIGIEDVARHGLAGLVNTVRDMAAITGLDWFVCDLAVARVGNRRRLLIVEPPDELAGLGPGLGALARVPADVQRLAAERLVEAAWRHARGLPITGGTTFRLS